LSLTDITKTLQPRSSVPDPVSDLSEANSKNDSDKEAEDAVNDLIESLRYEDDYS